MSAVVSVTGELDLATATCLRHRLRQQQDCQAGLVVDLAAVSFIDSSGLLPILEVHDALGDRLRLRSVPPTVTRLLTLLKLEHSFRVIETYGDGRPEIDQDA
jgi:anti-anti-sigma factor